MASVRELAWNKSFSELLNVSLGDVTIFFWLGLDTYSANTCAYSLDEAGL